MAIIAKVIRVPGAVVEVGVEDGATVSDALSAAGVTLTSGETLKLNGSDADTDAVLSDGARILIAKAAKGAKGA
jgi:hypothetical protein